MIKYQQKIKLVILMFLFLSFLGFSFSSHAQLDQKIQERLKNVATGDKGAGFKDVAADENVIAAKIGKIVSAFLGFLGIIFFLLILYGGWIWMKAKGNEEEVTRAKNLITQATIGLLIVLGAYAITRFIVSSIVQQVEFTG